ncbi:hypothetical protein PENTCL1PPCAC_27259, partial [Pristionchus entomophagus]
DLLVLETLLRMQHAVDNVRISLLATACVILLDATDAGALGFPGCGSTGVAHCDLRRSLLRRRLRSRSRSKRGLSGRSCIRFRLGGIDGRHEMGEGISSRCCSGRIRL